MPQIHKFTVSPRLPKRIESLIHIANNLWWSWDSEALELFFRIDQEKWLSTGQNPRRLLGEVRQSVLEALAKDDSFLAHLDRVASRLDAYLKTGHWHERHSEAPTDLLVAYMSAEFGVHESVKIYSGGLGVLAGDHLKAASDLGLPMVGLGLLYREGYFSQYLNPDGWQQELYPRNDFFNMPIELMRDNGGKPLVIAVDYGEHHVMAYVWKCQVGRVPLYLLDADHEENSAEDRMITGQLYGGDRETRIRQEIMLGMGGVLALNALGVKPTTYHMNEGHAAFMTLQRMKELVLHDGLTFDQSIETVKAGSFFTTHTPVPAGNDMFDPALIGKYFQRYCADVGISLDHLLPLGRQNPEDTREPFCMTVLALKLSAGANGVSMLHGEVARNMWAQTWKGVPEVEVPITSITNGIHTRTWISHDLADLYDRYLGPRWVNNPDDQSIWQRIAELPDMELWRTHERRRERLVNFARQRIQQQLANRGASTAERRLAADVLDPEVLTIGFARRFAMYKRGALILQDPKRLKKLLMNPDQQVQFIIAGKAHPQDTQAKEVIRELMHFSRDEDVRLKIAFIEDYDINVARYMVQGVDCWLNTPRRPMEASGTSGMKAAANGALNISIPDGWWVEAETLGDNGWSIGRGERYDTTEEQDVVESETLYQILEKEVIPLFHQRGPDGVPREWIDKMKNAIRTISPYFNTCRMVDEYTRRFYIPCAVRRNALMEGRRERALALADWKQKIAEQWSKVHFTHMDAGPSENLTVGEHLEVTADLYLGQLQKNDVVVEVFYGDLDKHGEVASRAVPMQADGFAAEGVCRFKGAIPCDQTGQQGFTVRAIPFHKDLAQKHETGSIAWA